MSLFIPMRLIGFEGKIARQVWRIMTVYRAEFFFTAGKLYYSPSQQTRISVRVLAGTV